MHFFHQKAIGKTIRYRTIQTLETPPENFIKIPIFVRERKRRPRVSLRTMLQEMLKTRLNNGANFALSRK